MKCNKLFIIMLGFAFGKVFCADIGTLEAAAFCKAKPLISVKARLDALSQKAQDTKLSDEQRFDYEILRRAWKKGLIQLGLYGEWNQLMNKKKSLATDDKPKQ